MHMETKSLAIKIAGLGKYLPPRIVTSAELEQQLNIPSGWVEQTTGVRSRRYAVWPCGGIAKARVAAHSAVWVEAISQRSPTG